MPRQPTPEPVIVSLVPNGLASPAGTELERSNHATQRVSIDLRQLRIDEFLQARSLSPNSKKAYQQDLKRFLEMNSN